MKQNYALLSLILAAALTTGCSSETDDLNLNNEFADIPHATVSSFAPDDGAQALPTNQIMKLMKLLKQVGPDVAKGLGEIAITQEEYNEIKAFTDDLVKDCATELEKYETIFNWLYKTLDYKHEYEGGDFISNDPYPVFKSHVAICQGFSNLQHVMLESQNIPCVNVNGDYVGVGGHAWNYAFVEGEWWVSDATNNGKWKMLTITQYKHLMPYYMDATLFDTNDCTCNYYDSELNVDSIKVEGEQFIVPFSAGGYKITSLNPSKPVPTCVKEIYISKNIKTLGLYYRGLEKNAPSVEAAYVDPENRYLKSFSGAVYKKQGGKWEFYYLPAALKKLELEPMDFIDKNLVFDHNGLEEVIIAPGTKELNNYAFEKCPNLRVAYVPEDTKVNEKSFYGVHPDFKIIRGNYTGIPEIRI